MKKPTAAARPARSPREVLAKVAPATPAVPLAAQTPAQLAASAGAWDEARQVLKGAGEAAAAAQVAFDGLSAEATAEQRHDAQLALNDAEAAVRSAQAAIEKLSVPEGAAGADLPVGMPPVAPGSAQPEPALAGPAAPSPEDVARAALGSALDRVRELAKSGDGAGALATIADQLDQLKAARAAMDAAEKMLVAERNAIGGHDAEAGLVSAWTQQLVRFGGKEYAIGEPILLPLSLFERLMASKDVTDQDPATKPVEVATE